MTTRTITIVTANLGRNGRPGEFAENLRRVVAKTPGQHRFFGFQEIDEADAPNEHKQIAAALRPLGYHFAGWNTFTPLAVPPSWEIQRPVTTPASAGVKHLSPDRKIVQAVVHPEGLPKCKAVAQNTHFARRDNDPRMVKAREDAGEVLEKRVDHWRERGLTSWLTADINTVGYPRIAPGEKRLVAAGLDLIRAYPVTDGCSLEVVGTGTIDLTIDGHNAHWAKARLEW